MFNVLRAFKGLNFVRFSPISIVSKRLRLGVLLVVTLLALIVAVGLTSHPPITTESDIISTPQELQIQPPTASSVTRTAPAVSAQAALDVVTIGLNFLGSELFKDSFAITPDTMGAVGPDYIVEMINGRFDVYSKTTGAEVFTHSLDEFWTTVVGLTIPPGDRTFDPRIIFDLASGRWFAISLDSGGGADNNIYLARSDTDDPTYEWDGIRFASDAKGVADFHDYDTLAVDADGLYICTSEFGSFGIGDSCYSIPKADLLLGTPSIDRMTRFEETPEGLPRVIGSVQPALDFGPSDGRAALLGVSGGALVRGNIIAAGGADAFLVTTTGLSGDPGHAMPPTARQPHPFDPSVTLENVAPRIVANVFEQGDSLWAVHAVLGSFSNSAIRWYEIDEVTNTVLQTGLIENPNEDFHEPSIAVNEFGNVVIGYTCSGPSLAPSSCVSVGETAGGVTAFESPLLLQRGDGYYYQAHNNTVRNRWGDYSATVIDPADPCTFWTFQEIVAVGAVGDVGPGRSEGGSWGIQITELTFNNCPIVCYGVLNLNIENQTLSTTETFEACETITAGPAVNVTSTGDVTFQAGERVILKSGVSVEDGGRLSVVIDPSTGRLP